MSQPKPHKLYHLTSQTFTLPFIVDSAVHYEIPAHDIATLTYPDGRWCFFSNAFLISQFNRGLSRRSSGGTIKTYACNISHLLRHCHTNQIAIEELTNSHFTLFIHNLTTEKRPGTAEKLRSANTVIAIGRTCLELLHFVGTTIGDNNFVSPTGRIKATRRKSNQGRFRKRTDFTYWHHSSFPTEDPYKKRLPVGREIISSLTTAASSLQSKFRSSRDMAMIKLLEEVGCRRCELVCIECDAVLNACKMDRPELKVPTAKTRGRGPSYRMIPISKPDILFIRKHIKVHRAMKIQNTIGSINDHGFLFVSESTGLPLRPNSVTQEIHMLARIEKVQHRVSPHMFRHRFITDIFITLMLAHKKNNPDDFRQLLIDEETIKLKVMQWSGHRSLISLEPYMHLASSEVGDVEGSLRLAIDMRFIHSIKGSIQKIRNDLKMGLSIKDAIDHLNFLLDSFEDRS